MPRKPPSPFSGGDPPVDELGWESRYSTHKKIVGSFELSISFGDRQREKPGYLMSINGSELAARKPTYPEAREHLLRTALKRAEFTVAELKKELAKLEEMKGGE